MRRTFQSHGEKKRNENPFSPRQQLSIPVQLFFCDDRRIMSCSDEHESSPFKVPRVGCWDSLKLLVLGHHPILHVVCTYLGAGWSVRHIL